MLAQRVVTAVILLAVLLAALLVPSSWPLVVLLGIAATCALWEWLRLVWPSRAPAPPLVIALLVACIMALAAVQWLSRSPAPWGDQLLTVSYVWMAPIVALVWVIGASALVIQAQTAKPSGAGWLVPFAIVGVWTAWAALVVLYLAHGAWFLVSLLALIWCADIAAYFTGKSLGRHKLAPKVSPGKTWEGAVGGVIAAVLWVLFSSAFEGSFGAVLVQRWSWLIAIPIAAGLGALSIIGDLFESLLKRRAGYKDSSQLLPGHGGVYDRIDALLPVAPLALLLVGAGAS